MSSMQRTLTGPVLVHHLPQDEWMIDPTLLAKHGRTARTLVKEGPLRLTMMALAPDGELPVHSSGDPVTIHVLTGDVRFDALGHAYVLHAGDMLVFAAGVEHAAHSSGGCVLLLTVAHVDAPASASETTPET